MFQLYGAYGNVGRPPLLAQVEHAIWAALLNVYLGASAESELDHLQNMWLTVFEHRVASEGVTLAEWFLNRTYCGVFLGIAWD